MAEVKKVYVSEQAVAEITGLAIQTLRNDRHLGRGIPYVKMRRSVRYFLPDVYGHMESRKIQTADRSGVNG